MSRKEKMQPPINRKQAEQASSASNGLANGSSNGHACDKKRDVLLPGQRVKKDFSDKDALLKGFEKPTQIYRFLGTRPHVFLPRTLSYMKERMSRNHQRRSSFKVDHLLSCVVSELEAKASKKDLHLNFLSFENRVLFPSQNGKSLTVSVEAKVVNVYHNKNGKEYRKTLGQDTFVVPVLTGKQTDSPGVSCRSADKFNELVIKKESFRHITPEFSKCLIIVTATQVMTTPNNVTSNASLSPDSKRRRKCDSVSNHEVKPPIVFKNELKIFNAKLDCLLVNGRYEIIGSPDPPSSYEGKLVVKVNWSDDIQSSTTSMSESLNGLRRSSLKSHSDSKNSTSSLKDIRINYRLFHNQTDFQNTSTPQGEKTFHCPWCQLNCLTLRSLKMHLKNCHSRFHFRVFETKTSGKLDVKIDVSLNDAYDGSYAGNAFAQENTGFAISREGPVRRNPVTIFLVNKKGSGKEHYFDPEDDEIDTRPLVIGHDRLYYHTSTCTPIRPQDMDFDSEDENDPQWMRSKTQQVSSSLFLIDNRLFHAVFL